MSYSELLGKELKFNYDITFEQAFERFPGISRENFDLIKYEYRRDVLGLKPKIKPKIKKKSNNYTKNNVKSEFQDQSKKIIKKLTIDSTEKLIIDMLNKKSDIPESQIRIAVDFMVKLKKFEGDEDDFSIDSKYLKLVGTEESEEVEINPHGSDDMIAVELNMEQFLKGGKEGLSIKEPEPYSEPYPEPNDQEES